MVLARKMMEFAFVTIAALWGVVCLGCDKTFISEEPPVGENAMRTKDADANRWAQIKEKHTQIKPGMTQAEVLAVLGQPEQRHSLFEPQIHRPRRMGSSWFYMKEPKPDGERGKTEIVIRFDTANKVTGVDSWGLNP